MNEANERGGGEINGSPAMEKTSKESVEERNLVKAFLAVRGLSCQACRLQQVTRTTVLVVPHLSPIPSQLQKKIRPCGLIDSISNLHAVLSVQEMQWTAKLRGGEGSLPTSCWERSSSSSPGCYWHWGTSLFHGHLVSARTLRPLSG